MAAGNLPDNSGQGFVCFTESLSTIIMQTARCHSITRRHRKLSSSHSVPCCLYSEAPSLTQKHNADRRSTDMEFKV